jgi:hypothetical protein
VTHPDIEIEKGRVLGIRYVPLFNQEEKVENVLFIVEDITEFEQENKQNKEAELNYNILRDILIFKDKKELSKNCSNLIRYSITILEIFMGPERESFSEENITEPMKNLIRQFNSSHLNELKEMNSHIKRIDELIEIFTMADVRIIIDSMTAELSIFIGSLIHHAETINFLSDNGIGFGLNYSLPPEFEKSVYEKIKDLERVMVNLLEYVFLVRNIKDLDKEKMANAPQKAKLYGEFDNIINLLMNRSSMLSFLLKVIGNNKRAEQFFELSELLKGIPSKNKLTEASLMNHLIVPFKKTMRN